MDRDGIGYARELQERRAKILANVPPAVRARILGQPAPYAAPKSHVISIDLRTGERTVVAIAPVAAPKPAPPPRPVVAKPKAADKKLPESIIDAVLEATGISRYEFMREGRCRDIVSRARQVAYWLVCRLRSDLSWPARGCVFRKHHSTVMSGYWRFEQGRTEQPISDWLQHPVLVGLVDAASKEKGCLPISSMRRALRDAQRPLRGRRKGERHPEAKMTAEQVVAIRADGRTGTEIAAAYGVSRSCVRDIRNRTTWRHI